MFENESENIFESFALQNNFLRAYSNDHHTKFVKFPSKFKFVKQNNKQKHLNSKKQHSNYI